MEPGSYSGPAVTGEGWGLIRLLGAVVYAVVIGALSLWSGAGVALADGVDAVLPVPYATQFDGSKYAATNCGPTALGMVLSYATGRMHPPAQVRLTLIRAGAGYAADPRQGTAIQDLARVARGEGVEVFAGDGRHWGGWWPERIRDHLRQGHPVVVLVRLRLLPGHQQGDLNHWIVIIGETKDGAFRYHDPALPTATDQGWTISETGLVRAQQASAAPGQGAAFGGPSQKPPVDDGPTFQLVVAPGDTLSGLAKRYEVELGRLHALNRRTAPNVHHIEVGQVLIIPSDPRERSATKLIWAPVELGPDLRLLAHTRRHAAEHDVDALGH